MKCTQKGEVYTDIIIYETMDNLEDMLKSAESHPATLEYNTFVNQITT